MARICDWANKCSPGNNMAFNKGIGYDSGASVPLGYCLEICLIVDGTRRKKFFLVFSLFLSSCPIHRSSWAWCGVSQRIISPNWSSSPRSWGFWIMLFMLVPGALSCQALCSVEVTGHSIIDQQVTDIKDNDLQVSQGCTHLHICPFQWDGFACYC